MINRIFNNQKKQKEILLEPEIERAAIRYAEYDWWGEWWLSMNMKHPRDNLVEVGIFFRDPFYVMIERDMRITELDFVSNIGGLMGLLMGFSFISLIELLYHVCLTLLNIFKSK